MISLAQAKSLAFSPSVDRCCWVWTWWDRSSNQLIPFRDIDED